jgi:hypothetical protein
LITSRGLVVISGAGEILRYHDEISPSGMDAPMITDITGEPYSLYRCTRLTFGGREYGFIAALTPLTESERLRAADRLFGSGRHAFLRFDRVPSPDEFED